MAFETKKPKNLCMCMARCYNKAFRARHVACRVRLLVEAEGSDAQAAGQPRRGFGADSGAGLWVSWEERKRPFGYPLRRKKRNHPEELAVLLSSSNASLKQRNQSRNRVACLSAYVLLPECDGRRSDASWLFFFFGCGNVIDQVWLAGERGRWRGVQWR